MTFAWRIASLAFAAGLVVLWQLLADQVLVSRVFFPAPSRAFAVLGEWASNGELWHPLAGTVWRMLLGWGAATILGVALGAAIASSALTRDLFEPTIEFLPPLPSSAMIPRSSVTLLVPIFATTVRTASPPRIRTRSRRCGRRHPAGHRHARRPHGPRPPRAGPADASPVGAARRCGIARWSGLSLPGSGGRRTQRGRLGGALRSGVALPVQPVTA